MPYPQMAGPQMAAGVLGQPVQTPLEFLGRSVAGRTGGLLLDHPRFYDNYASGTLYRDFETLADIQQSRSVLDAVAAFDDLLSKMKISLKPLDTYGYVGHHNLS